MKYLLDTDTCVYWLRGRKAVQRHLVDVGAQAVAISILTLAELRYGAACSTRPDANHQAINSFVNGITVLTLNLEIAHIFGDLKARLRRRGMLIEDFDLAIAATALCYRLTLVTNNQGHFGRIPQLPLDNWV